MFFFQNLHPIQPDQRHYPFRLPDRMVGDKPEVVYIAKKFDNTGVGVEDLISIGTIGLIKAINTFLL